MTGFLPWFLSALAGWFAVSILAGFIAGRLLREPRDGSVLVTASHEQPIAVPDYARQPADQHRVIVGWDPGFTELDRCWIESRGMRL